MKSAVGRDIPTAAAGYGPVAAFAGAFQTTQPLRRYAPLMKQARPGDDKVLDSLAEAFQRIPVKDGMTLSFHHHFRNGDGVLNQVLAVAASLGRKNLNMFNSRHRFQLRKPGLIFLNRHGFVRAVRIEIHQLDMGPETYYFIPHLFLEAGDNCH